MELTQNFSIGFIYSISFGRERIRQNFCIFNGKSIRLVQARSFPVVESSKETPVLARMYRGGVQFSLAVNKHLRISKDVCWKGIFSFRTGSRAILFIKNRVEFEEHRRNQLAIAVGGFEESGSKEQELAHC